MSRIGVWTRWLSLRSPLTTSETSRYFWLSSAEVTNKKRRHYPVIHAWRVPYRNGRSAVVRVCCVGLFAIPDGEQLTSFENKVIIVTQRNRRCPGTQENHHEILWQLVCEVLLPGQLGSQYYAVRTENHYKLQLLRDSVII